MKIAIFGAGAIGGYLAVKLHQAGAEVSVIARGPHLAAIRENGLTLKSEGETVTVRLPCTDKAAEAGPQDYVIVTLKANGLPAAAPQIAKLMGPDTALVTGINGIPYWYFYGLDGPWRDRVGRKRRSGRQAVAAPAAAPGDRLRRLSGGRSDRARRDRAHLWQPLHPGRAGRQQKRARRGAVADCWSRPG